MSSFRIVPLLAAALLLWSAPAAAQIPTIGGQRPTPEQLRALLQTRPDLVEQLKQRVATSGMTREQIRARLRAEGYPEDLLDPYLPGAAPGNSAPDNTVFAAVTELGIADSADVGMLRELQRDTIDPLRDTVATITVPVTDGGAIRADVIKALTRADSGYTVFGLELFRSGDTRVAPPTTGPVDANYRLGPGDRLVLILTGDVEASHVLDVTREGFVVIPQVGQISVANLTLGQFTDVLYSRLGRVYSGVRRDASATTRFTVSVSRLRTNQIYVVGEVENPGSYMISSAGTALTSLFAAGGPSPNGSLRDIQIKRGGQIVAALDLYDYLLRGDASRDVRLESGDIVFVPPRGAWVRVFGAVLRPATYELRPGETLAHLIAAAGGFTAEARRGRIHIERILAPAQRTEAGRERVTIDVSTESGPDALAAVPLLPGDVVQVFEIADRVRNTITVTGNVWNPGRQGIRPGMVLSEAIRLAGGPKPDVYLGQILVSRLRADSTREQLRAAFRDTSGAVVGDFQLREDDVIQVFSLAEFRPARFVAIGGAVRKAGRYPYRRGMTMRDLILLAGGLTEGAYLQEAEIARLPEERTGLVTATTLRVSLDSSYLFERRPDEPYLGAPGVPAAAGGAPEILLQPYDNVLIMQQPNWELQRVVTVSGEVRFPGQYALKTRNERFSDIVARAGGLTSEAYPAGTVFIRERDRVGRVAIDAQEALRRPGSPENLTLLDGDRITIPQRSNIVSVRGAVNAPNVVAYVPGADVSYYIAQAGGPTRRADEGRAFVTQPNGKRETVSRRFLFPDGHPVPMPGSVVEVPEEDLADRLNYAQLLGALAPIISTLASVAIVIITAR